MPRLVVRGEGSWMWVARVVVRGKGSWVWVARVVVRRRGRRRGRGRSMVD